MSELDDYRATHSTSDGLREWTLDDRIPRCIHVWLRLAADELDTFEALQDQWWETYSVKDMQIAGLQKLSKAREKMLIKRNEQIKMLARQVKKLQDRLIPEDSPYSSSFDALDMANERVKGLEQQNYRLLAKLRKLEGR